VHKLAPGQPLKVLQDNARSPRGRVRCRHLPRGLRLELDPVDQLGMLLKHGVEGRRPADPHARRWSIKVLQGVRPRSRASSGEPTSALDAELGVDREAVHFALEEDVESRTAVRTAQTPEDLFNG
jgi:hypothetical protein